MKNLHKWEYVTWNHEDKEKRWRIVDVFIEEVERSIDWETFHVTPSKDKPAYLVEQDDWAEFIVSFDNVEHSKNQDHPVTHDNHERMNDKKHTF